MKHFVEKLTEIKKDMFAKMNVNEPMDKLTFQQKTEFKQATRCSICNKKFQPDDERFATTATSQGRSACKI